MFPYTKAAPQHADADIVAERRDIRCGTTNPSVNYPDDQKRLFVGSITRAQGSYSNRSQLEMGRTRLLGSPSTVEPFKS